MKTSDGARVILAFAACLLSADSLAAELDAPGEICVGYGPQAPRDIDNRSGNNMRSFSLAPTYSQLNLCNLHFHSHAEHKAEDFAIYAGTGDNGHGGENHASHGMFHRGSEAADLVGRDAVKVNENRGGCSSH